MNHSELLEQCKKVEFCAIPTVQTMDMGLEYDFVSSEGAGSVLGAFGEWPAIELGEIEQDKWQNIREKTDNGILSIDDLKDTSLEKFATCIKELHPEYYDNISNTFSDLSNLPKILSGKMYCIFDLRAWNDTPEFFETKQDCIDSFQEKFCWDYIEWNNMEDEELEDWLERIDDEFKEFPFLEFNIGEDDD